MRAPAVVCGLLLVLATTGAAQAVPTGKHCSYAQRELTLGEYNCREEGWLDRGCLRYVYEWKELRDREGRTVGDRYAEKIVCKLTGALAYRLP